MVGLLIALVVCGTIFACVALIGGLLYLDAHPLRRERSLKEARERVEIARAEAQVELIQLARDRILDARLSGKAVAALPQNVQDLVNPEKLEVEVLD